MQLTEKPDDLTPTMYLQCCDTYLNATLLHDFAQPPHTATDLRHPNHFFKISPKKTTPIFAFRRVSESGG